MKTPCLIDLVLAHDERGTLAAFEFSGLPFEARRIFTVYGTPAGQERGGHAHRRCDQVLICLNGMISIDVEDEAGRLLSVSMGSPAQGVYVPAGYWASQRFITARSVLLVIASQPYDPDDYIRDHDEWKATCATC